MSSLQSLDATGKKVVSIVMCLKGNVCLASERMDFSPWFFGQGLNV